MPITKQSLFKFESISLETGQCEVRFINKYGPIYTREKTLEDFKQIIQVPTGSFTAEGVEITKPLEIVTSDNPNEDFVYSFDIPLDAEGNFISEEDLVVYIANQYPHDIFESIYNRKKAPKTLNVNTLTSANYNVEIVIPDPTVVVEDPWLALRDTRNTLLMQSDWTQLLDSALTDTQRRAWAAYRQALRDLPENTVDPLNVIWPTPPV
jgi:hypothetical protein